MELEVGLRRALSQGEPLGILQDDLCEPKKPRPTTLVISVDPFRVNSKVSIQSVSEKMGGGGLSARFDHIAAFEVGKRMRVGKNTLYLLIKSRSDKPTRTGKLSLGSLSQPAEMDENFEDVV
jgi:hypothetical protein